MFDCTMMNDEVDLLEIRLNTLYPFVEKFVLVESERTHSGKSKDMNYLKYRDRFERFKSKIIYLQYQGYEATNGPLAWGNENNQRNMILQALEIAKPEDGLFFVSDIDEIPKPEKLFEAKCVACRTNMPVSLNMANCMYFMNLVSDVPYRGPYLYNPALAQEVHAKFGCDRYSPCDFRWHVSSVQFGAEFHIIPDAGWHFSTMGGVEAIRNKLDSYAHVEFNTPEIRSDEHLLKCMSEGIPYFENLFSFQGSPLKYSKRDVDSLPDYVRFNLEKFKQYILE